MVESIKCYEMLVPSEQLAAEVAQWPLTMLWTPQPVL